MLIMYVIFVLKVYSNRSCLYVENCLSLIDVLQLCYDLFIYRFEGDLVNIFNYSLFLKNLFNYGLLLWCCLYVWVIQLISWIWFEIF